MPTLFLVDGGTDIERRHDAELGASFGGPADADVDAEIWRDLGRAGRERPQWHFEHLEQLVELARGGRPQIQRDGAVQAEIGLQ